MIAGREFEVEYARLEGLAIVRFKPHRDDRGFFVRGFAAEVWDEQGFPTQIAHTNVSGNPVVGTLRGLHYQIAPHEETKSVHCVQGRIWDVAVDIRPGSPTFLQWESFELELGMILVIPAGFAHGFQTLEPNSLVVYHMSHPYAPEAARGISWEDPTLSINWPMPPTVMSERDRNNPQVGPDGPFG